MARRRRKFFRDDILAPWLTLLVVIGLWWAGASWLGLSPSAAPEPEIRRPPAAADRVRPAVPPRTGREKPVADAPETHAVLESADHDHHVAARAVASDEEAVSELKAHALAIPVQGIQPRDIVSNFDDERGSDRRHEALDILSPRGTPVVAVEDGQIAKLFTSARGGLTVYHFDRTERFCYYYAHLDRYADDLKEGQIVKRGQIIGYVGTSGNAPPDTPHLHFAIFRLGAEKKWWDGTPVDPALVLR